VTCGNSLLIVGGPPSLPFIATAAWSMVRPANRRPGLAALMPAVEAGA
jgi:hypothetical protein